MKWGDLSLTSVHQPFPHCFSHIEGDPLFSTFGQYIPGSNVALFPNVFICPYNLQNNIQQLLLKVLKKQ